MGRPVREACRGLWGRVQGDRQVFLPLSSPPPELSSGAMAEASNAALTLALGPGGTLTAVALSVLCVFRRSVVS